MRRPLLLVVDSLDAGGAERHVVDLAAALVDRGWRVHVACSTAGPLAEELFAARVPVHVLAGSLVKRRTCRRYAASLRRLVEQLQPELVHAHVHASEVAAALALHGLDVPLVLTEHTEAPWRSDRETASARSACARADVVVAVSSAVRRNLVHRLGVPAGAVQVVLPAVLPAERPARPLRGQGAPTVGYVGRLAAEKGVDVLLDAFLAVREQLPAARLLVVGDGPERRRLAGLADRAPGVELLGFRRDARALLPQLDVLAVPSRSDGSPLAVAEAQAAGAAVVASDVGGLPDRVRHGCDGLLVPPGDSAALARALVRLLCDDALRSRLVRAGRQRAAVETHEAMVDRLEQLYAQLLPLGAPYAVPATDQAVPQSGAS